LNGVDEGMNKIIEERSIVCSLIQSKVLWLKAIFLIVVSLKEYGSRKMSPTSTGEPLDVKYWSISLALRVLGLIRRPISNLPKVSKK